MVFMLNNFWCSKKFLSNNSCEFNNTEIWEPSKAFNMKVMTTVAESPWSKSIYNKNNVVNGNLINKIIEDGVIWR